MYTLSVFESLSYHIRWVSQTEPSSTN